MLAAAALVLTACGGSGPGDTQEERRTATIGTTVALDSLDPINPTGGGTYQYLIFDNLIDFDKNTLELQPGLATEWAFENPLRFVMTLREGVTFSDGLPFDAAAVKKSIDRYVEKGVLFPLTMVRDVEVVGPMQVAINLTTEFAWLPHQLADVGGLILSPAAIDAGGDEDLGDGSIGTGPYVLKEHRPGVSVTFVPNETYWDADGRAQLDELTIEFFRDGNALASALATGQLDGAVRMQAADLERFQGQDDYQVFTRASTGFALIWFNWESEQLADPRVRRAINFALDRDTLAEVLTEGLGTPAYQIFPPDHPLYDPGLETWTYDPERARQLMAEAGRPAIELDCILQTGTGWETIAPVIIDELAAIGITLTLRNVTPAEAIAAYYSPGEGTTGADCALGGSVGWVTLRSALFGFSHSDSFYTPATTDGGVDAAIEAMDRAYTPEEQKAGVVAWARQQLETPTIAPVANRPKIAVLADGLEGYVHGILQLETFRDMHWAGRRAGSPAGGRTAGSPPPGPAHPTRRGARGPSPRAAAARRASRRRTRSRGRRRTAPCPPPRTASPAGTTSRGRRRTGRARATSRPARRRGRRRAPAGCPDGCGRAGPSARPRAPRRRRSPGSSRPAGAGWRSSGSRGNRPGPGRRP